MKKYLRKFENQAAYNTAKPNLNLPSVSLIADTMGCEFDPYVPLPELVDLGLPSGLLWMKCNLGAETETDYGGHYAWGEVETKEDYSWNTYKFGTSDNLTKYNTIDGKTTLDPEDDVIQVKIGNGYRMPTESEYGELINNTNKEWVTNFKGTSITGYKFTNKLDSTKYIFIPAAGYWIGTSLLSAGVGGYVWSSSLYTSGPAEAHFLFFSPSYYFTSVYPRYSGYSVRGVKSAE